MEINIDNWHEFAISELFTYERGKEAAPKQNPDGDYRLISETQENNGFIRMVKPTKIIDGHCLTVSVNYASTVFYQEEDFCASVNIIVLRPKDNLTKNQLLFTSAILSKQHESYSYTDKVSKDLLMSDIIKLPAIYNTEKEEYEPDWEYMEEFIRELKEENEEKLASLKEAKPIDDEIDISDWHEFEIGELFETENEKRVPTGSYVAKNILYANPGDVPRITVKGINNGVDGYYDKNIKDDSYRIYENFISVTFLGDCFYQKDKASLDMKVHCLKPLKITLNEKIALFLITIIRKEISNYNYGDQLSSEWLKGIKIKLPAIYKTEEDEYNPDWEYMEEFITNLQENTKNQLRRLR